MNPVIGELIRKDWKLHQKHILLLIAGEVAALAVLMFDTETSFFVGTVCFFIALIFGGCLLAGSNVLNERKKQTLPFMMSLPITPVQYSVAKIAATVGMFLAMWLPVASAGLWLIAVKGKFPHGAIPVALILLTMPFLGFTIVMAANVVGETEGWNMAAVLICNSSYGVAFYFLMKVPALTTYWAGAVAVWNSTAVSLFGGEFGLAALTLALTFYLQSRKRDFI